MAKANLVFPKPTPVGIELYLSIKEARALNVLLNTSNLKGDPGGSLMNIRIALNSNEEINAVIGE